jgi:hypothetical protein
VNPVLPMDADYRFTPSKMQHKNPHYGSCFSISKDLGNPAVCVADIVRTGWGFGLGAGKTRSQKNA